MAALVISLVSLGVGMKVESINCQGQRYPLISVARRRSCLRASGARSLAEGARIVSGADFFSKQKHVPEYYD